MILIEPVKASEIVRSDDIHFDTSIYVFYKKDIKEALELLSKVARSTSVTFEDIQNIDKVRDILNGINPNSF